MRSKQTETGQRSQAEPSRFRLWWLVLLCIVVVALLSIKRFRSEITNTAEQGETLGQMGEFPPAQTRSSASEAAVDIASQPVALRFAQLFQLLENEPDELKREELIRTSLRQLVLSDDIPTALRYLQSFAQTGDTDGLSVRLLRIWSEGDARAAAAWVDQLPSGSLRQAALSGVAIEWANQEPTEAANWARQLADESERVQALQAIGYEVTRSQPVEALTLATELPPGPATEGLIDYAAMEWASRDGASATQWTRQIQDPVFREQVLANVAIAWADSDPVSAATIAATELNAGSRTQADAAVSIVQRWAQRQPEQAAAWVEQFPDGELKLAAVANVAAQWANQDPVLAEQWINQVQMNSQLSHRILEKVLE